MTPIQKFIEFCGSNAEAARAVGVHPAYMSNLASGKRQVSPALALKIERKSGGLVSKESLIWPKEPVSTRPKRRGVSP
jgi:DNA-binding transcriptional regulator YdaS (Cro superfamily)